MTWHRQTAAVHCLSLPLHNIWNIKKCQRYDITTSSHHHSSKTSLTLPTWVSLCPKEDCGKWMDEWTAMMVIMMVPILLLQFWIQSSCAEDKVSNFTNNKKVTIYSVVFYHKVWFWNGWLEWQKWLEYDTANCGGMGKVLNINYVLWLFIEIKISLEETVYVHFIGNNAILSQHLSHPFNVYQIIYFNL